MKLTSLVVAATRTGAFGVGQNEKLSARIPRMTAYWQDAANAVLYPVGNLLSVSIGNGRTLADVIASGEEVELGDSIEVEGVKLPLQDGAKLSLANLAQSWGCVACRSAHGSAVYPSREVSVKGLKENKFFYNPATRALFVISDTCWKDYVVKLGAALPTRFMGPKQHKAILDALQASITKDVEAAKAEPQTAGSGKGRKVA
jgi:hypothetical protein